MTAILRRLAAVTIAVGLAIGGPARAQPTETPASQSWVHCETGVVFPAEADGLVRSTVAKPDANSCVKQVSYKKLYLYLRGGLRISIRPGGNAPCAELFAREDTQMREVWRFLKPDPDGKPLRLLGSSVQQHTARYIEPESRAGRDRNPETRFTLWIGCIGPNKGEAATWLIRYQEEYKAADEAKVAGLAEELFAAIDWTPLTGG